MKPSEVGTAIIRPSHTRRSWWIRRWSDKIRPSHRMGSRCDLWYVAMGGVFLLALLLEAAPVFATHPPHQLHRKQLAIPILGTTLNRSWESVGIVKHVKMEFETRRDRDGLFVKFRSTPGYFSPLTQRATKQAIVRAAQAAGLHTDSWSIILTLPYWGIMLYGDSLSAMIGFSVVALAKNEALLADRVITGTITAKGRIGAVGRVPLKIQAAYAHHFQRVLIPEERAIGDGDWQTPFLMQVSPVGTTAKPTML